MTAYTDIIDSLTNGQVRQALSQANEFGWYELVRELELDQDLSDRNRFDALAKLCRAKHRHDD